MRFAFLIVFGFFFLVSPAQADEMGTIAAIVNKKVITIQDVDNRIKLASMRSLTTDPKALLKLRKRFLDVLIDETIKISTAERFNIKLSDEELQQHIIGMAKSNGMTPSDLEVELFYLDIPKSCLEHMIRASIAWNKTVSARYYNSIRISKSEIEAQKKLFERARGRTQFFLQEIFIPKNEEERVKSIFAALKAGKTFTEISRNFKKDSHGNPAGQRHWITSEELYESAQEIIPQLKPGQISKPLEVNGGFAVVLLLEKRAIPADAEMPTDQQFEESIRMTKIKSKSLQMLKQMKQTAYIDNRLASFILPTADKKLEDSKK